MLRLTEVAAEPHMAEITTFREGDCLGTEKAFGKRIATWTSSASSLKLVTSLDSTLNLPGSLPLCFEITPQSDFHPVHFVCLHTYTLGSVIGWVHLKTHSYGGPDCWAVQSHLESAV